VAVPGAGSRLERVAVLGLDGAPPGWLEEAVEALGLQGLADLLGSSVSRRLEPRVPATWPSWSSIMTGVPPGWHGVTGFFRVDRGSRESRLMTSMDLEHPRVWEVAGWHGLDSLVVNPVPEWPIIPARGARILSWFLYRVEPASWPRDLARPLEGASRPKVRGCGDAPALARVVEAVSRLVESELRGGPPALAWVTLRFPDELFHKCPRALADPRVAGPALEAVDSLARALHRHYESVIIVSDHGFSTYRAMVSVNDVLAEAGLVRPRRGVAEIEETPGAPGPTRFLRVPPWAYRLVHALRLAGAARAVLGAVGRLAGRRFEVEVASDVDLASARAALLHDIDHQVVVFDGDPREVAALLESAEGIASARPTSEALAGPHHSRSGDVLVLPDYDRGYMLANRFIRGMRVVPSGYHTHHPHGVVYASGAAGDIVGGLPDPAPNTGIASTVYCLLGVPLPAQAPVNPCGAPTRDYRGRWALAKRAAAAAARLGGRRRRASGP